MEAIRDGCVVDATRLAVLLDGLEAVAADEFLARPSDALKPLYRSPSAGVDCLASTAALISSTPERQDIHLNHREAYWLRLREHFNQLVFHPDMQKHHHARSEKTAHACRQAP